MPEIQVLETALNAGGSKFDFNFNYKVEPDSPSIGNWYESQLHYKGSNQRILNIYSIGKQVSLALFSNAILVVTLNK